MITVIRKNQKIFMLVVAILTVIAFAWLYNPADPNELGANVWARVYGKMVTPADRDRISRTYMLASGLGFNEYVAGMVAMATSEEQAIEEYVFNVMVMRRQAEEFGIMPSTDQVAERIRALPVFQDNGTFSPEKFEQFSANQLTPRGLTTLNLEATVRDVMTYERIREVVTSTAVVSEADKKLALRFWQPMDISLLKFPIQGILEGVQVSEEDLRAYFDLNSAQFMKPEQLTVQTALFKLPEEQAKLEGKERVAALRDLATRAETLAAVGEPEAFAAAAEKDGATLKTWGPMPRGSSGGLPEAVARTAFLMDPDTRELAQVKDDLYVIRVVEKESERPLTFEEAKPQIEQRLKRLEAEKELMSGASEKIAGIREALAAGKTMAQAIQESGAESEVISGVELQNPEEVPLFYRGVISALPLLEPNQISNFQQVPTGGAAVALLSRAENPAEGFDAARLNQQLVSDRENMLFLSWLATARKQAEIVIPRHRGG